MQIKSLSLATNRGGCYEILSACFEVSVKKKSENISFVFRIGTGKYHDFEHQHDTKSYQ